MNLNKFSSNNLHQGTKDAHLATTENELEALSYSVSHDLRAPLHMIQNNCEWLNIKHAAKLDSEGRTMLKRIATSSEQMEKLLDGLLALSKAVSIDCTFSIVDMIALARGVIDDLLQYENEPSSLLISIKPLPPAYGDAILLRQVWYNLLSNAFKYTRYKQRTKCGNRFKTIRRTNSVLCERQRCGFRYAICRSPFRRISPITRS